MTTIQKIKNKIDFLKSELEWNNKINTNNIYIIIHPETERNIYLNGEISKSENLEEHLGFPIILSKEVKVNEIIIGI